MQGLLGKHIVIYLQNANETLLQHRMKNILRNNISSQVAWRPFHIQSFRYQGCTVRKVLNTFYTLFIFLLLIFGYTSSIIACQARLDVKHKVLAFRFFKVELFIAQLFLAQWPEYQPPSCPVSFLIFTPVSGMEEERPWEWAHLSVPCIGQFSSLSARNWSEFQILTNRVIWHHFWPSLINAFMLNRDQEMDLLIGMFQYPYKCL